LDDSISGLLIIGPPGMGCATDSLPPLGPKTLTRRADTTCPARKIAPKIVAFVGCRVAAAGRPRGRGIGLVMRSSRDLVRRAEGAKRLF
jgi:hypothetical protein